MNVTCPNCATVYRVDPAKVPEAGVRARCAVCSAVFAVAREQRVVEAPPPPARFTASPPAPAPLMPPPPASPP
nr:zinc-ribbon domain-containing protein [Gemmatimonadales bacterium]